MIKVPLTVLNGFSVFLKTSYSYHLVNFVAFFLAFFLLSEHQVKVRK